MGSVGYNDIREFIEEAKKISDFRQVDGADWNNEIGTLIEATTELVPQPPMLMFDNIKGYPPGYRILSLPLAAYKRVALAMGLPTDRSKLEILRLATRKFKTAKPVPPKEVATSPLMENVMKGDEIDLFKFPALHYHEHDGGRYLGTGDCLINADLEGNFINMGTYRMQLHDKNLLGLWMSPGQHGRLICMKYWEQGKACPVVAAF
nr:UbiD family decarboxylase [Deltaproteobacteria bacterium]